MRLAIPLLLTALLAVPAHAQNRYERAINIGRVDSIRSAILDGFWEVEVSFRRTASREFCSALARTT